MVTNLIISTKRFLTLDLVVVRSLRKGGLQVSQKLELIFHSIFLLRITSYLLVAARFEGTQMVSSSYILRQFAQTQTTRETQQHHVTVRFAPNAREPAFDAKDSQTRQEST